MAEGIFAVRPDHPVATLGMVSRGRVVRARGMHAVAYVGQFSGRVRFGQLCAGCAGVQYREAPAPSPGISLLCWGCPFSLCLDARPDPSTDGRAGGEWGALTYAILWPAAPLYATNLGARLHAAGD